MFYVYQDFSKTDKKKLVALVEVGVKNEIEQFLQKSIVQHQAIVNATHEDIRKPYWKLADSFKDFSKNLTRTYDGWSHRKLPNMIAILIVEGILSKTHIADFTPEGKEKMEAMIQRIRNFREM